MADKIYFQWQNPTLLKTIYPMREVKLRDFLIFFKEIDLWNEFRGKSVDEFPELVRAYEEAQVQAVVRAVGVYKSMREYFLTEDVQSTYQEELNDLDPDEVIQIHSLHNTFKTYFPTYNDVSKEKYFVTERTTTWKARRKEVLRRINEKSIRVKNIAPEHPRKLVEEQELQKLQSVTLAMAERELERLEAFETAISDIEPRKKELDKTRRNSLQRKDELERQMAALAGQITSLETQAGELKGELSMLRNPPDMAGLEAYFTTPDVTKSVLAQFPKANQNLLATLNTIHKELAENYAYTNSVEGKAGVLRTYFWRFKEAQKAAEKDITKRETDLRNMPETWSHRAEWEAALVSQREAGLPALTAELDKIATFQAALDFSQRSETEIATSIEKKGKGLADVEGKLSDLQGQVDERQSELNTIQAALGESDEKKLVEYVPEKKLTIEDIVRWKTKAYQDELSEKDQYELLKLIRQRFNDESGRFPRWLQYMVVHFSGMRYASAHGSWADPKDLLIRLGAPKIEAEIKALSDEEVAQRCQEMIAVYESEGGPKPKLVNAREKEWNQQIGWHLPNVKANGPKSRRNGLTELSKLEAAYEIFCMPIEEVLARLLSMKDQFPSWAWKDIIKLTPLRLTEVNDPNWENLTSQEEQERFTNENYELRTIIDGWKNYDLSAWRDEHSRSLELIVTRAVCNETAEHIQHLRGNQPIGGLAARPPWYLRHEKENQVSREPRPYFVKATDAKPYIPGASVLWLHFTPSEPNVWQIAKQITTLQGEGLLRPGLGGGQKKDSSNAWSYQSSEIVTRTRTFVDNDKKRTIQKEWLGWLHEATIVETAETVDGIVVLTFETALPSDDKGTSSIGMFKKSLAFFLSDGDEDHYNRSFVGYVPDGQPPEGQLEKMLDWDKILPD